MKFFLLFLNIICLGCFSGLLSGPVYAQSLTQNEANTPFEPDSTSRIESKSNFAAPDSPPPNKLTDQEMPVDIPIESQYHSQWAQNSVRILQENGITLPEGINYDVLMNQGDFIGILARISGVSPKQLTQYQLFPEHQQESLITRGEGIHFLLVAFGLVDSLDGFKNNPSKFVDLPPSHPAYSSIVLAESVHLINGYPDRTIRPNERLSWGEALILVETVYSWKKALPTTAPEWVKSYQKHQNMWFQLIDGFRLLLTIAYVILALYFLIRSWKKTRRQRQSPFRSFSLGLAIVTVLLGALWISELLFNYALIPREIYASLTLLSIFAGLFLLKLSSDIDGDIHKPKPQTVIDSGYVESINYERGELFIRDKASNHHSLALVSPESKILKKTGLRSVESAFLSDIQTGDQVSLRGGRLEHDSLMEIERITLVESAQQQQQQEQQKYTNYSQNQQQQQQYNHISPRPPQA